METVEEEKDTDNKVALRISYAEPVVDSHKRGWSFLCQEHICAIIFWTLFFCVFYAAYILALIFGCKTTTERVLYSIMWTILYVMIFWCLFYASYYSRQRCGPPSDYYVSEDTLGHLHDSTRMTRDDLLRHIVRQRRLNATYDMVYGCEGKHEGKCRMACLMRVVKYCQICGCIKPPRCHHCSSCNVCIIRMDHHCPVIGACIGHTNYKAFLLFLMYTCMLCIFASVLAVHYMLPYWIFDCHVIGAPGEFIACVIVTIMCIGGAGNVGPVGMLLGSHIWIAARNQTTIEYQALQTPERAWKQVRYDQGAWWSNLTDTFGTNPLLWLVPLQTGMGDGTDSLAVAYGTAQDNDGCDDR